MYFPVQLWQLYLFRLCIVNVFFYLIYIILVIFKFTLCFSSFIFIFRFVCFYFIACRSDQFQCSADNTCIESNLRCNQRNDCSDGSDEYNCPTVPPPFVTPEPEPQPISCPYDHIPCRSQKQCIRRFQLCDGRVDCNDMSDETNCRKYFNSVLNL